MLTCDCDTGDDPAWYYHATPGVAPLSTKRARKCRSCGERINVGDDCKHISRWEQVSDYRHPEVVVRIYGDGGEHPLPSWYLCDRCAGLYESLDDLGFCDLLGQDLRAVCAEYADMQREAGVFKGRMVVPGQDRAHAG